MKGKSTLLNAIAFRNRNKLAIDGDVKINGQLIKSFEGISSVAGYVQQEDLFIGYLTVEEHLKFQVAINFFLLFSI